MEKNLLAQYNSVLNDSFSRKTHIQIDKDVERTFGEKKFFRKEHEG